MSESTKFSEIISHTHQWRDIASVTVDYINSDVQLSGRYPIKRHPDGSMYVAFHIMGSRTVGIVYIGSELKEAFIEIERLIRPPK